MEAAEILNWLPHREPFMLIDRITEMKAGEQATAIKCISFNEPFLAGHFPGNPIVPGVIMLEALAQLCCVLAFKTLGKYEGQPVYLMGFNEARFRRMVKPGDVLTLHGSIKKTRKTLWVFSATAKVGDEIAVETEIMAGIG